MSGEEDKYFTAYQVRAISLKKYKNLLTSERWSNKDSKDYHILAIVVVAQKLAYESNKSTDKSNTPNKETTK